ncbi:hypothetical protein KRP22_004591 [Phytophthora ramorum]|nr:RxLR effector protein [Phytophthora ramorum]
MRLHYFLLLVTVAFLSSVGAASATTSSKFLPGDQVDSVGERLLRTETAVDKDDSSEERGFVLPGFAQNVAKLAKSRVQNVQARVKQFRVESKFRSLELHTKSPLSSPELKKWADSVAKLYKNDPERSANSMLTTLTKYYDENTVTRWVQAAKGSLQVGTYARNLQALQFTKWMDEGLDVAGLQKKLITTATSTGVKRDGLIEEAFGAFIKKHKPTSAALRYGTLIRW